MPKLLPDQSFYPSPTMAMQAPAETLAYVALLNPDPTASDALAVLDVDPASPGYGAQIARVDMPGAGDELHHFGGTRAARACARTRRTRTCSGAICRARHAIVAHPHSRHRARPAAAASRQGDRGRRNHSQDRLQPPAHRALRARRHLRQRAWQRRRQRPGGIFVLDPETFEIKGRWEKDRGPQHLSHDFWWHLGHDTMITSEWARRTWWRTANPELLLAGKHGNALHVWDLNSRRHLQKLGARPEYQMVLELRPAHDPNETYGFVGVVTSLKDLSASVWMWHREGSGQRDLAHHKDRDSRRAGGRRRSAADAQGVRRRAPLVTDINLSLDDRFLRLVLRHRRAEAFDVSDPFNPVETGSVKLGGIVRRQPHPARPGNR